MTAVEDALQAGQSKLQPKRNQWGQYLLPHPETGEEMAFQRATTLAKMLGDTFAIDKWHRRMVAKGVASRSDLHAMVAAATLDEKKLLDDLCEQAAEAAGATEGRNKGSAIHRFTERVDAGEQNVQIPAPFDADVAAYRAACTSAGITAVPGYSERIVVVPSIGVAGTFDRLNQHVPPWPVGRIGDVKSAQKIYDWLEIAIQLSVYSRGVAIWDLATQAYLPMPPVDQDVALVFHIPAGSGSCRIYEVDIATGWDAALKAVEVRSWRKRKGLATAIAQAETTPTVDASTPAAAHDAALYVRIQNTVQAMSVERQMALSIELARRGLPRLSETPAERLGEWADAIAILDAPLPDRDELRVRVLALTRGRTDRLKDALGSRGLGGITATPDERLGEWEQLLADVEAWADPFDEEPDPTPVAAPPAAEKPTGFAGALERSAAIAAEGIAKRDTSALRARVGALPADLVDELDAARAGTILDGKNLVAGGTPEEVALAEQLIAAAEARQVERYVLVDELLEGLDDDMATVLLEGLDRARLTQRDVDQLQAIVQAIDVMAVMFTYTDDGVALVCTDRALDELTKKHGNRATVLAVGREVARALGRPSLRSAAEVAADPVVTALTLHLTINQARGETKP